MGGDNRDDRDDQDDRDDRLQSCGHPASSIRGRTTHWCADCEEEARAAERAPVSAQSATGEFDVTVGWQPDDRDVT